MNLSDARASIGGSLEGIPFKLIIHDPGDVQDSKVLYEARWRWRGGEYNATGSNLEQLTLAVRESAEAHFKSEETKRKIQRDIEEDRRELPTDVDELRRELRREERLKEELRDSR